MNRSKLLIPGGLVMGILVIGIGWRFARHAPTTAPPIHREPVPHQTRPALPPEENPAHESSTHPPSPALPGPSATPEERQQVLDAIDNLEFAFRDYANALGGNPVGTNAEITAALQGDNPNQLKLEIPGGSSINSKGELCDRWDTPWFFHQLSARKMEIRSAGPDRVLYSGDDLVR